MRFLHTSDWHVGRAIRGRSRHEEFAAALDEVVAIAREEAVDAVLLAGDVYEHRAASPEADAVVFDSLVRLHEAGISVVAIPGNHDSPKRFEALAKLLAAVGTSVVPAVVPPDEGSVVEVASRDGSETAVVACVPFVPERRFGNTVDLFAASEAWYQSYAAGLGGVLEAMAGAFRADAVNVLMAHLFTDGALVTPGGGERELTIGMAYAIPPSRLPAEASYVALGHVHKPQAVKGSPSTARYAGSLLQLDFGEAGQRKSVAIVEALPGKPAAVREVPITAGRRLVDLRGTLDDVLEQGADTGDAYLRVFVTTDGPVPGLADRVREALPNALHVEPVYERPEGLGEGDAVPVSSLSPRDQFFAYYRNQHGVVPDDALAEAFDEVLAAETEG